jgi:hypothetical protein
MYVIYNIVMGDSPDKFTITKDQYDKIIHDIETLKDRNNRIIMNMVSNNSISDSLPGVATLKAVGKRIWGLGLNERDVIPKYFEIKPELVKDPMVGFTRNALYNTNGKRDKNEQDAILSTFRIKNDKTPLVNNDNMGGGQNVVASLLANPEKIAEPVGVNDILSE